MSSYKTSRRDFMKSAGIATISLATGSANGSMASGQKKRLKKALKVSKNAKARKIVFIMTDTQRWDMVGCYGNKNMKTPHLDKLADEGIRFDRAYTCSPVCGPARSAIFTGTYPHSNGVWGNNMPLGNNVKTIGQRLNDNGYHTAYVGKWHLDGFDYFDTGICPDGWDEKYWYCEKKYLLELSDEDKYRSRQDSTNNDPDLKADFTFGHRVANRAVEFLENHNEEDFFLVASFDEPHHPWLCPEPYSSMYKDYVWPKTPNVYDDLKDKPALQKLWSEKSPRVDKNKLEIKNTFFWGSNSFIDYEIGRVISKINEVAPDALVIYTSDHGDMQWTHGISNCKGPVPYDENSRVPFIVRWPGHSPAGTVTENPVSHINIVPTLLEAAGLEVPGIIEGPSILKTLEDTSVKPNEAVFTEYGRYEVNHDGFGAFQPMRVIFDGRYKLCINLFDMDEMYDMQEDEYEMKNLINSEKHAKLRNKLHDSLLDWMNQTRDPFRGQYWSCRPWRTDMKPSWKDRGFTRPRPDDGYLPRVSDYDTGLLVTEFVRKK
ncbi:MAG: sulfatase-like hydrolase/transferase [Planctomycetes bacterium]|nr:sulfatase-like hydrolase/transferase [Planctomycetota bacterium]